MPRLRPLDFYYSGRARRKNGRLVSLKLRNFKSVVDQEVQLSPLTIIVGKNSSGKSTVLQSLLFLAQNAANPLNRNLAEEGNLDLNGELVSLGIYREAKNDRAKPDSPITIGGTFEFDYRQTMDFQPIGPTTNLDGGHFQGRMGVLDWETDLQGAGDNRDASIVLSISGRGALSLEGKAVQSISSERTEFEHTQELLEFMKLEPFGAEQVPDIWDGLNVSSEAKISSFGKLESNLERPGMSLSTRFSSLKAETHLQGVKHLLGIPVNGLTYTSRFTFLLNRQKNYFDGNRLRGNVNGFIMNAQRRSANRLEENTESSRTRLENQQNFGMSDSIQNYVGKASLFIDNEATWITSEEYESTSRPLIRIDSLPITIKSALRASLKETFPMEVLSARLDDEGKAEFSISQLPIFMPFIEYGKNELANQIVEQLREFWKEVEGALNSRYEGFINNGIPEVLVPASLSEDAYVSGEGLTTDEFEIGDAVSRLSDFLEDLVYLGPLRLEPNDIYKRTLGSRISQLPLGMQGEHLARVVSENPRANYPLPPESKLSTINGETDFQDALNDWLKWLGIAKTGIEVATDRHYGYRLTVDRRYLRSLGVGVSQVIPVIGVCLLAEAGSLVLLEEPELHLNPNIQQKLADFFLAMTASGRQLIVETHSEYLITRLRLRAMQNPEISNSFSFVFTEQEHEDWSPIAVRSPYTVYRTVRADEKGELPEWPAGFFDQVTTDVQALLDEMIKREGEL